MIILSGMRAWTGDAWGPLPCAQTYARDEAERLADTLAEQQRAKGMRAAELARTDEVIVRFGEAA